MYKVIGGDQQEYGPSTAEEIAAWIAEGRLSAESMARSAETGEWRPLSRFPEFAAALQEQLLRFPNAGPPQTLQESARFADQPGTRDLRVGVCLGRAGQFLGRNFMLIAGASVLVWFLSMLTQFAPVIGGILYLLLHGVFYGGLYALILQRIRGGEARLGGVFAAFGPGFGQLMLAGFVTAFLSGIGFLLCVVPWVYLTVAWIFAVPLVADRRMEFWAAMELSRRVATRVWWKLGLLLLLAFLPVIATYVYTQIKIFVVAYPGFQQVMSSGTPSMNKLMEWMNEVAKVGVPLILFNKLVLLFNLPFAASALMYAYEDLFGSGEPPEP